MCYVGLDPFIESRQTTRGSSASREGHMKLHPTLEALRRRPILFLWFKECRTAIIALSVHAIFMIVLLGPTVRFFVPKPKVKEFLGLRIRSGRDSYPDVVRWLDAVLWPAGWALVGAYAKSRVKPSLEQARSQSDALAAAADKAATDGDLEKSIILLSRAEALQPEPARRARVLDKLREQKERASRMAPEAASSSPGAIGPGGRIRLLKGLGRGAVGMVHLGEDGVLGRRVAVKELSGPLASAPEVRERFLREARALAQISSPHVVQVFEIYQEGERQFLSMELCEGEDLAARLKKGGRLPAKEVARLGAQIAEALDAAHRRGVVHRDLKPANVLFSGADIKVADFGLARLADSAMTQEGAVMGTPYYMAPEQAAGATVDGRSDLYALGCVLFEMLSGKPPYLGTMEQVLLQHISSSPPPALDATLLGASKKLCALVSRLLAKNPAARPKTARDVATALRALS